MPGKRKSGASSPINKLNDAVNLLTDGEFDDWMGLDGESGREYAYRHLVSWHRGKCPHDPNEEKKAFDDNDIYSLRKQAIKKLVEGMNELRAELPRELVALQDAIATHTNSELDLVMGLVAEAKKRAIHRGYFESLKKILAFEKRVVFLLYEGAILRSEARRVKAEIAQAKANISLAKDIAYYRSEFLESVRDEIYKKGIVNQEKVAAYNSSSFAKLDVSEYPARLFCAKIMIDEFFFGLAEDTLSASKCAESISAKNRESVVLSPSEHSRLLTRLATYYSDLRAMDKAREVISFFEEIGPEKIENQKIYLKKYLLSLFHAAIDANEISLGLEGVSVFERNEKAILDSEQDKDRLLILIFLMTFFLGCHQGAKAKRIFDLIYKIKDQKPPLQYRIQYMISHLMILFELKEYEQMQSFGKNYKEFFNEYLPLTAPACAVLDFLRKNVRKPKEKEPTYRKALILAANRDRIFNAEIDALLAKMATYAANEATRHSLMYGPFTNWLESKRLKLVNDGNDPNPVQLHKKRQ